MMSSHKRDILAYRDPYGVCFLQFSVGFYLIRWIKILKLALGIILVVRGDKMVKQTVVIHFGNFFSTLFSPPCNVNKLLKGIPN
jgi:hypothetical protein